MTPRRTKLEEALKIFSKFSQKFLQKPESVLLFCLDTVEHMGYDEGDEPQQMWGHVRASDSRGFSSWCGIKREQYALPAWGKEGAMIYIW